MNKEIENLKKESLKPIYFLHGSEPYFIDLFVNKIIEIAIPDFEKGFNEYILYGKDISIGDVLNYARKYPMMAEKQLIVIKEAHSISDLTNKDSLAALENYFSNPLISTILVLSFGKNQDEKKTWVKAAKKQGEVHNFSKMRDYEVPNFIQQFAANQKINLSPKATVLISEHIGNNLQSIVNEINKLKLNLKENETVTEDHVEKYIGISKDFNVFELQKAIIEKNTLKCFQITEFFSQNIKDHPIQPNIIILYNFFTKVLQLHTFRNMPEAEICRNLGVNPYFLKDYKRASQIFGIAKLMEIIKALKVADLNSKGIDAGSISESDIYKNLLLSMLF